MNEVKKLKGCDVSSWNYGDMYVSQYIKNECDFVAVKLTEGATYVNPYAQQFIDKAREVNAIVILYHFCRPDGTTIKMQKEIDFFCENAKAMMVSNKDVKFALALDWEARAEKHDVRIMRTMVTKIKEQIGVYPFIYVNEAYAKAKKTNADIKWVAEQCGLWLASWTKALSKNAKGPWKFIAIWQYTNSPFDLDMFFGERAQLEAYCVPADSIEPPDIPDVNKCECCCCRTTCGEGCVK